jgi:hypothetical protein
LFAESLERRRVLASVVNAAPVVASDVFLQGIEDTVAAEINAGSRVASLFSSRFSDSARDDIQSLLGSRTLNTASLSQDTDQWLSSASGTVAMNGYTYWLDGGTIPYVKAALLGGVRKVVGNGSVYAAIRADGSLITWGDKHLGGDCAYRLYDGRISVYGQVRGGVTDIIEGFAAKSVSGATVVWGSMSIDGPYQLAQFREAALNRSGWWPSGATKPLQVISNGRAFAGLSPNGSLCTWGTPSAGGYSTAIASELTSGVAEVVPFQNGFIARKTDGRLIAWGEMSFPREVEALLFQSSQAALQIVGNRYACAVRLADNRLVAWGDSAAGGDASAAYAFMGNDAFELFAGSDQFIALTEEGVALSWGAHGLSRTVVGGTLAGVVATSSNALPQEGVWQYYSAEGSWCDLEASELSDSSGVFIDAASSIRFVPKSNFGGSPGKLFVRAVESSPLRLRSGDPVDASVNGGTSIFSATATAVGITVQDRTNPIASISTVPGQVWRNADSVMIEFSEPVTGMSASALRLSLNDVPVNTAGAIISGGPSAWFVNNLTTLAAADGNYTLSLGGHGTQIRDIAGNSLATATTQTWLRDTVHPTMSFAPVGPIRRNAPLNSIGLSFSESIVGLTVDAFTLMRDDKAIALDGARITGGGTNWSLAGLIDATAAAGNYQLRLNASSGITDLAGNTVMLAPEASVWQVDTTLPIASFDRLSPTLRIAPINEYRITFSEPVKDLDVEDFALSRNGLPVTLERARLSGDGDAWTLSGLGYANSDDGSYVLSLTDTASVFDIAGNLVERPAAASWTVDQTSPKAFFGPVAPTPRNLPVSEVAISFSEPISNFTIAALVLTRDQKAVSLANAVLTGNGRAWRISGLGALTGTAGTYRLAFKPSNTLRDAAGNPLGSVQATSWEHMLTVTFGRIPESNRVPAGNIELIFNSSVTGLSLNSVQLMRNGRLVQLARTRGVSLTGAGNRYLLTLPSSITAAKGSYVLSLGGPNSSITMGVRTLSQRFSVTWQYR